MLTKLVSDALGLSGIEMVIPKTDFDKTESDDLFIHESGKVIYFLIIGK